MIKLISTFVLIVLGASVLISCQSPKQSGSDSIPSTPADVAKPVEVTQCKEPRSPICTKEYRPVCATRDTGVRCVTTPCPSTELVTKGNACTACADEKVSSYVPGKCS